MTASASSSTGSLSGISSLIYGESHSPRTRSQSRVRDDSLGTPRLRLASDSTYNSRLSSDGPLLPYDMPTPSLAEFPMPPKTQLLPHPHAPAAPTTGITQPAIHRSPNAGPYPAPNPNTTTLSNTLARAAVPGYQNGPGRTIHGRTSMDLLSAKGPVPIHFALGTQGSFTTSTPIPRPATAVETPIQDYLPTTPSPILAPSPQNLEVKNEGNPDRRSYTDIIAAIETPR